MAGRRQEADLVVYVQAQDVEFVRGRVPAELRGRLRDVFLRDRRDGVRRLGWVVTRGRRDIDLVRTLPPRVSLRPFCRAGSSPAEFGAPLRGQWPPWSVRRYLLYDVFVHELGHLQLVLPGARSWRRRFAGEPRAQAFADDLRRAL